MVNLPFKPNHVKEYQAINLKCLNCSKVDHFIKVCPQGKTIKVVEDKSVVDANIDESQWEQKQNIPVKHLEDKITTECSQIQHSEGI